MSARDKRRSIGALVPFDGDASVRLEGIDLAFTVPVVALSHDALLVRAPESSPAGSLVHIELTTGTDLVHGMGEVAGVRPVGEGHELLIQLLYVDEQSRTVLRRLVSESEGETTVEWASGGMPSVPGPGRAPSEVEASAEKAATPIEERPVEPTPPRPAAAPPPAVADDATGGDRRPHPVEDVAPAPAPRVPDAGGGPPIGTARPGKEVSGSSAAPAGRPAESVETPAEAADRPVEASDGPVEVAERGPAWKLDPIDPTEVAAVDLGPPGPAWSPSTAQGSTHSGERPSWWPEAEAIAAGWQKPSTSSSDPPSEREEDSGGTPAASVAASGYGSYHEDDEGETRSGSRTWLIPAAVLILAFAAAAWWTRDAWLGSAEPSPPAESSAEAASAPSGTPPGEDAVEPATATEGEASVEDAAPTTAEPPSPRPASPVAATPLGPVELLDVDVKRTRLGETSVTISLSGPISESAVSTFGLGTPPRFLVKLLGVSGTGFYPGDTPELARVRIAIHDGPGGRPETHVVFDLAALGTTGEVVSVGQSVQIRLRRGA